MIIKGIWVGRNAKGGGQNLGLGPGFCLYSSRLIPPKEILIRVQVLSQLYYLRMAIACVARLVLAIPGLNQVARREF